jgi:hypothetical protein
MILLINIPPHQRSLIAKSVPIDILTLFQGAGTTKTIYNPHITNNREL